VVSLYIFYFEALLFSRKFNKVSVLQLIDSFNTIILPKSITFCPWYYKGDIMTDAAWGAGNDYPSGAPDFTYGFHRDSCCPVICVSIFHGIVSSFRFWVLIVPFVWLLGIFVLFFFTLTKLGRCDWLGVSKESSRQQFFYILSCIIFRIFFYIKSSKIQYLTMTNSWCLFIMFNINVSVKNDNNNN